MSKIYWERLLIGLIEIYRLLGRIGHFIILLSVVYFLYPKILTYLIANNATFAYLLVIVTVLAFARFVSPLYSFESFLRNKINEEKKA